MKSWVRILAVGAIVWWILRTPARSYYTKDEAIAEAERILAQKKSGN